MMQINSKLRDEGGMGLLKITCLPHSVTQVSLGHDKVSPYEVLSVILIIDVNRCCQ